MPSSHSKIVPRWRRIEVTLRYPALFGVTICGISVSTKIPCSAFEVEIRCRLCDIKIESFVNVN